MLATISLNPQPQNPLTEDLRENSHFGTNYRTTCSRRLRRRQANGKKPRHHPFGPREIATATTGTALRPIPFAGFKAHRTADGPSSPLRPMAQPKARLNRTDARSMPENSRGGISRRACSELNPCGSGVDTRRESVRYTFRPVYVGTEAA